METIYLATHTPSAEHLIRVASRNSNLAKIQVREFFNAFPELNYELISLPSLGDNRKDISLLGNPPDDLFTREQDELVLSGRADIAIHSAKDMPYPLPKGLQLIALTAAMDTTDALVSRNNDLLHQLPAGARVATSSPTRRAELLAVRPDLRVDGIRGTIEERLAQVDSGEYDALIVASCALQRLGLWHRATEVLPFRTHPLQGSLGVVARIDRTDLYDFFRSADNRRNYGQVSITGFGPGDPELLTRRATTALQQADQIFYDDLIDDRELDKYTAKKLYVGKRKNKHSHTQEEINHLLVVAAQSGQRVVRLKGGDPMIFAHGGEEAAFLSQHYIPFELIPGISTGIALASLTGIPLTFRGLASSVAFVTGHTPDIRLPHTDTVVVYMGSSNLRTLSANAISDGRDPSTPVMLVSNLSLSNEAVYYSTLEELSTKQKVYDTPLIVLIGKVVSLRNRIPEKTRSTLLVTGTRSDVHKLPGKIIHQPLISIQPFNQEVLKSEITQSDRYEWLIFTSHYSVKLFFEALYKEGYDSRSLVNNKIVSVGQTTSKALLQYGIIPNLQPDNESSEGIVELLANEQPGTVLLPRSDLGLSVLPTALGERGWKVTVLPVYKNQLPDDSSPIDINSIDELLFSSPSCVTNFKTIYGSLPKSKYYHLRGNETKKRFNELI